MPEINQEGNIISQDQTQETGGGTTLGNTAPISKFKEDCFDLRGTIDVIKLNVKILKADSAINIKGSTDHPIDLPEILANLQLAYRHLEDARMRLGKAVQAYDGGESCYPR